MSAGRKNTTDNKEWGTPIKIIKQVQAFWDFNLQLDPCSNDYSLVNAKTEFKLPIDGLKQDWEDYYTIFVNPPYGRDKNRKTTIADWIKKCYETYESKNNEIIALIPVATNTKHWKQYIWNKGTNICFLSDTRLQFLENGIPNKKGAPMACCLIYWGEYSRMFNLFFKELGAIINLK